MPHSDHNPSASSAALASRLLGRGGRILGLAAAALASGQGPGGTWHALPPDTLAATEEILHLLCACPDDDAIEQAMARAFSPFPTAAPGWARAVCERPESLRALAAKVDISLVGAALPSGTAPLDDLEHGMAALAVALCRSPDALSALSASLPSEVGTCLERMGRLAHAQAEPGVPSRVRSLLRRRTSTEEDSRG